MLCLGSASLKEASCLSVLCFAVATSHSAGKGDSTALDFTVYSISLAAMPSVTDWPCQEEVYVHLSFPRYQYVSLRRREERRTTAADCENFILWEPLVGSNSRTGPPRPSKDNTGTEKKRKSCAERRQVRRSGSCSGYEATRATSGPRLPHLRPSYHYPSPSIHLPSCRYPPTHPAARPQRFTPLIAL